MLTKLLKYEFQATARKLLICYAALLAASLVLGLMVGGSQEFANYYSSNGANVATVTMAVLVIVLFVVVWVFTLILLIQRFEGNLLGAEGYLMHTLPVSSWQLITSKLIAAICWIVISSLVSFISFLFIMMQEQSFIRDLIFDEILPSIDGLDIATSLVAMVDFVLLLYASMMVGQLFNKGRRTMTVVAFVVFIVVDIVIGENLYENVVYDTNSVTYGVNAGSPVLLIYYIVMAVIFYVVTDYLMRKHLNLQ